MMFYLLESLLFSLCLLFGIIVKYTPFAKIISVQMKKKLFVVYAILLTLNFAVVCIGINCLGIAFFILYLKYGVILSSIAVTVINIIVIRKRHQEHLFILGFLLNLNLTMLHIPNFFASLVGDVSTELRVFLILIVYFGLLGITCYPFSKLISKVMEPFLFFESMNYINTVCYIPVIFFALQMIDYFGTASTSTGVVQFTYNLCAGLFMFVISISALSSQGHLKKSRITENQIVSQEIHYKELETRVNEWRKTRHDIKHIISAIDRFIELDDKEGLRDFSHQLACKTDLEKEMLPYTGNPALDGVVYSYMNSCALNGIEFKYSGTVPECNIDSMDICVLIGNALENAYTACLRLEKGKGRMSLLCKKENKLLSVMVQNTFDGKLKLSDDDKILSLKRDNEMGIGMVSMKNICDRYGGVMEYNWTEDTFNIVFILPVN